jgi:aminopeptidase N
MGRLLKLTGRSPASTAATRWTWTTPSSMAMRKMLSDDTLDPAFREQALLLPSETMIAEQIEVVDPLAIHLARQFMRADIGARLRAELLAQYQANQTPGEYSPDAAVDRQARPEEPGLAYLCAAPDAESLALAQRQFDEAGNMTDRVAALGARDPCARAGRRTALQRFYDEFEGEALVIDKWFAMQASSADHRRRAVRELMRTRPSRCATRTARAA